MGWMPEAYGSQALFVVAEDSVFFGFNGGFIDQMQVSRDRGRTGSALPAIPDTAVLGHDVSLRDLVVGLEGRLWVGTSAVGPGGGWRTTEPIVAVGAEQPEVPDGASEASLAV